MKYNVGSIILVILMIVGLFYVFQLDDEHKKTDQTDTEDQLKMNDKAGKTDTAQQPKTNGKVVHSVKELSVPTETINERATITFTAKNVDSSRKQSIEIKGFTKGKAILVAVENRIDSMIATVIGPIHIPNDVSIRALIESETDDPITRSAIKKTLTYTGKVYTGFTSGLTITIEDDSVKIEDHTDVAVEDFPVGSSEVIGFERFNNPDPNVSNDIGVSTMLFDDTIRELIDRMEDDR